MGNWEGTFIVVLNLALINAFPKLPRLVVIRITPLAPLDPYTAVAEASFKTETVSTDPISTLFMGRSIPSTNISGDESFQVLAPRITIRGSSSPGIPVLAVVIKPGALPVKAAPIL